jgi:HPt (histidine-containing phosphotransfer) domain-containing protein
MANLSPDSIARIDAPPLAPVEQVIDADHLARMTFGDRRLERDVLELFDRQAVLLLERMQDALPDAASAMAHTLKGSAQGVGAWKIAAAAEQVERAAARPGGADLVRSVRQLGKAIDEARVLIVELLRAA